MKKLFLFFSIFTFNVFGQDQICSEGQDLMVIQNGSLPSTTAVLRGGREITTQGTLRVLVVFVRFKDDNVSTATWPYYQFLPSWASTIVDQQVPANNIYSSLNMSNFFDRASGGDGNGNLGTFRLIGDVKYVTTDSNRSYYGEEFTTVNEHVLSKLDATVNFATYDNWTFIKNGELYNHENVPDGKVDYIFMIWRGVSPYSFGNLGIKNLFANLTLDGKTISNTCGSTQFRYSYKLDGVDKSIGGPYSTNRGAVLAPAHEFTHYIFGYNPSDWDPNISGHLDGRIVYGGQTNIGNIEFFSFMTSNSTTFFSAYERYRAGWLNPDIYESNNLSNVILQDTHVKNKAIMLPIRRDVNNEIREYFLIENFHTQNDYTGANPFLHQQIFNYTLSNGLLVFHIEDDDREFPTNSNLDLECSDGLWDWDLSAGQSTPADKSDDWIYKKIPAPNSSSSYDDRDFIYIQVGSYLHEYMALTPGSVGGGAPDYRRRYTRDAYLGDNEDFFRIGETNVFSRYSNPNTSKADLSVTNRGFEVTSYNSSTKEYTLKVAIDNNGVLDLAPSKPQNPKVEVYTGGGEWNPKITWAAMSEPDVTTGGSIYVERCKKLGTGTWTTWTNIATLAGNATQYIDLTFTQSGVGNDSLKYRVRAKDSQNKYSVYSDEAKINFMQYAQKRGVVEKIPTVQALLQNFPNPFNPSTMFRFELPEDEHITLRVFDMLGKEVATVVNGYRQKGYYEEQFDASSLPSGMYVYRLTAGAHSSSKKMMLMK